MDVKTKDGQELYKLQKQLMPVSTVLSYAGNSPPDGYLECNGASVSRLKYRALFHEIGTTYGSDSATTFKLPDLRGEFVRGWDHGRGIDAGRNIGTAQADAFKAHRHAISALNGATADYLGGSIADYGIEQNYKSDYYQYPNIMSSTGGTETRPRNIALMYIIKY